MSEETPEALLQTAVGDVRLIKTGKTRRFTEVRRHDGFAWSLAADNVLTNAIAEKLETDLPGSVALNLFERSSMVWTAAAEVPVSHDPDDLTRLEETVNLLNAAQKIADAMRTEIDADAIIEDALGRIDGEFFGGSPSHVQIGRRVKAEPDRPERYFGQLAPLGVTNVGVVLPWLGYVPAIQLTDWFHWRFHDLPWHSGPNLDLVDLKYSIWVRPSYWTSTLAVESAGTLMEVPVATRASDDLPSLHFEADEIAVCSTLRIAFARNLRIVGPELDRPVTHMIPLAATDEPWGTFPEGTPGLEAASSTEEIGLLCPFGTEEALEHIENNEALLFHILWMTETRDDFPLDPWDYVDMPRYYVTSRETGELHHFHFEEKRFRRDLAQAFVASYGDETWEGAITAVARTFERLQGNLEELERAVSNARSMGVNPTPLDRIAASIERIREEIEDPPQWTELTGEQ